MNYSERISIRMGQFANNTIELADGDAPSQFIADEYRGASHFATVNWVVAPRQLPAKSDGTANFRDGLPEKAYRVEFFSRAITTNGEDGGWKQDPDESTAFDPGNAHTLDLSNIYGGSVGPWGFLAAGFLVTAAAQNSEVFGVDTLGDEIVGTRQLAIEGDPCVLFGPNLFKVRATANITIMKLVMFTVARQILTDGEYVEMANVGPGYLPDPKPANWRYDGQSILSAGPLDAAQALAIRLEADSLARANVALQPPVGGPLSTGIHKANRITTSDALLAGDLIKEVAENVDGIIQDPSWIYQAPAGIDGKPASSTDSFEIPAVPVLQLLTRTGPIEAVTLGQAVTLPVNGFPNVTDRKTAHEIMWNEEVLPFPLVRVTGWFFDVLTQTQTVEFGLAGLDLWQEEQIIRGCRQNEARRPQNPDQSGLDLDLPATADVELVLKKSASPFTFFVSQTGSDGTEKFYLDPLKLDPLDPLKKLPKTFIAAPDEGTIASSGGSIILSLGQVDLPFEELENIDVKAYPRDVYGRWLPSASVSCDLLPWPVGHPELVSCKVEYREDETIALRTTASWDRKYRRQASFEIGLRLGGSGDFKPSDGVRCPAFPEFPHPAEGQEKYPHLRIVFDNVGNPMIDATGFPDEQVPAGLVVEKLTIAPSASKAVGSDESRSMAQSGAPDRVHSYEIVIPLGSVGEVLSLDDNVQLTLDASEVVSGYRRSKSPPPLPLVTKKILDPRPPVLTFEPWKLTWASLPNGTGDAKALVELPEVEAGGPSVAGFHAWRAQETAVLDVVLRREFDNPDIANIYLKTIRRERNMKARLALIQGLLQDHLQDPEFEREFSEMFAADSTEMIPKSDWKNVEISINGRQSGFEFVMFTAVSNDGVSSVKRGSLVLRTIAVPDRSTPLAPELRVISHDTHGIFVRSGVCIAIVSHRDSFDNTWVRFHWDAGQISHADELLERIEVISELSVNDAKNYVPEIEDILAQSITFSQIRIFLIRPKQTWRRHHFAVDIKVPERDARNVLEDIPTPRSNLESHDFDPREPMLVALGKVSGALLWRLKVSELPATTPPGRTGATIVVILEDDTGNVQKFGPKTWKILLDGFSEGSAERKFSCNLDNDHIYLELKEGTPWRHGTVVISDPARRKKSVRLAFK